MVTCFSKEAHSIVTSCNEVTKKLQKKNPYKLPLELAALQGKTYIFQLHYGQDSTKEESFFFLDKAWDTTPLLTEAPATDVATPPTKTETQDTSDVKPKALATETSVTPLLREATAAKTPDT